MRYNLSRKEIHLKPIRAILFDSANVLMRPLAPADAPPDQPWRKWFPGPGFESIVRARYPKVCFDGLDDAILLGMEELDRLHAQPIRTLEEEAERFAVFYRIALHSLGIADAELACTLARVRVHEQSCEPYADVPEALERLHKSGLEMGVLSEAWPSLELNYRRLGLRDIFRVFIISANHGILKDDTRLFDVAKEQMDTPAENTLFLDDWAPYVQVAIKSGFQGAVVARDADTSRVEGLTYVVNLNEVEELVVNRAAGRLG